MKKATITTILFVIVITWNGNTYAQFYNPFFYDKAKHFQYKSMEDGPWKFYPKYYYTVFHRKYRKKYSPNKNERVNIMTSTYLENNRYSLQAEDVVSWKKRELNLSADRIVDFSIQTVSGRFDETQKLFIENMKTYTELGDSKDLKTGSLLMEEYNRIMDNKKIISRAHLENSKRQVAYNDIINDMDKLNAVVAGYNKILYNRKVNQQFFKNK